MDSNNQNENENQDSVIAGFGVDSQDKPERVAPAEQVESMESAETSEPVEPETHAEPESHVEPKSPIEPVLAESTSVAELTSPVESASSEPSSSTESIPLVESTSVEVSQQVEQPKKKNTAIIWIIVIIVVFGIVGVVIVLMVIGVIPSGGLFGNSTPTPELARTVCEKYGGKLDSGEGSLVDYSDAIICDNSLSSDKPFKFEEFFVKDDKLDRYWQDAKTDLTNAGCEVLENSDTFIKCYADERMFTSSFKYTFEVMYKNAVAMITAADGDLIEDLLVELGFPDRSRGGPYGKNDSTTSSNYSAQQRDTLYRDDLARLVSQINQYQANNRGKVPEANGWESFLNNYMMADQDGFSDPETGNPYRIEVFESLDGLNESELDEISSDEFYVFYNAKCGEDGSVIPSENNRNIAVVHSSATGTEHFCTNN